MLGCVLVLEDGGGENHASENGVEHLRRILEILLCLLVPMGRRPPESPMNVTAKLVDAVLVKDKLRVSDIHHTVNVSVAREGTASHRLFVPVVFLDSLVFLRELPSG